MDNAHETVRLIRESDGKGFPVLLLAGGSNVVIGDAGFPGTAVVLRSTGVSVRRSGDGQLEITVAAGQTWDDVVAQAVAEGWSGIECLSGIPGSTGATPIQNVGAYGQEVAETITSVRVLDRQTDEVTVMPPGECGFSYRHSVFKHHDRWVVLEVGFRLAASPLSGPIRYAELARTLGVAVGDRVPLAEVREAVLGLRRGKGMVLDDGDPDTYSVGSFFVNPVLDAAAHADLLRRCEARLGPDVAPPAWPGGDGGVKTSAAWLIERAGFAKGYQRDGARWRSRCHWIPTPPSPMWRPRWRRRCPAAGCCGCSTAKAVRSSSSSRGRRWTSRSPRSARTCSSCPASTA